MTVACKGSLCLAVLVALVPPALAQGDPGGVRTKLEAANRQFTEAVAKGDAARMAALYSPQGQLLPPGREVVQGKDAIQGFWRDALVDVKAAELSITDVAASGDLACETGTYVMKGGDGAVLDRGKYVVVWRREQGEWKILRDIWNTNQAPPAVAPAAK